MKRLVLCLLLISTLSYGDDGYRLWLKYDLIKDVAKREEYARSFQFIAVSNQSPIVLNAAQEVYNLGYRDYLAHQCRSSLMWVRKPGGVCLNEINFTSHVDYKSEGYLMSKSKNIYIVANRAVGVLYGTFALLRAYANETIADESASS